MKKWPGLGLAHEKMARVALEIEDVLYPPFYRRCPF
jgi:hypothetical protein